MSDNLSDLYRANRFQLEGEWPPDQPKTNINLAFINFKGKLTQQRTMELSTHKVSALCTQNPSVTKDICEIFNSPERCILIEGAPGIGKTVLCKEIAFCWANGEMFQGRILLLLLIRDPNLQSITSIDDLLKYLGKNRLSSNDVEAATDMLKKIKGLNLVFVIDGYDECPLGSALKGFVDELYKGECLKKCRVLITSRPSASLSLRQLPCQRIEILGLAKEEQEQYISESLKESPIMQTELQEYLKQQPIINSLIYVPLNLAILLYLFKKNTIPETLTEMNEYFIMHTIYRHLTKETKDLDIKLDKISDLPEAELTVVYQLSKLAYIGLREHRLIFTDDEIKEICPKINDIPGAINGLGLLQAEKCYYQGVGISASFNFLHLTMQEYLAALHVSTLPIEQQSILMHYLFFDYKLNFMWVMYTGITRSQPSYFTDIVSSILSDNKNNKCAILFLFQCFLERKDLNTIPNAVTSMFSDGNVDLSGVHLLPHHVMSLIVFMTKSSTKWKSLNLERCLIDYKGISILATFFSDFNKELSSIQHVNLSNNMLTSLWETQIDMDNSDSGIIVAMESPLLSVQSLDLSCNQFNDSESKKLFSAIKFNRSLRKLNFSQNYIISSIDITVAISECLKTNKVLQELDISKNNITDEGAKRLAEAMQENSTLSVFNISKNFISKKGIMNIIEACTNNMYRTINKLSLVCTHNYLSKAELVDINKYTKEQNVVRIVDSSWNCIGTKDGRLVIKTISNLQQKLQSSDSKIDVQEEIQYINRYEHTGIIQSCIQEYLINQQSVNLRDIHVDDFEIEVLSEGLKLNNTVTELNLSKSELLHINSFYFLHKIDDDDVCFISNYLRVNTTLCKLNLSGNEITDSGIKTLAEAITDNVGLQMIDLSRNNVADEGAKRLGECIAKNTTLLEINISKNWISKEGIMRIAEACTQNKTLHKLVCTHNNLSQSGLETITKYIREETTIQVFDASWNTICVDQGRFAIQSTIQLLDNLQQKLQSNQKELPWNLSEIPSVEHKKKFLLTCFEDKESIVLRGIEYWCLESKQNVIEQDDGIFNFFQPVHKINDKTKSLRVTNNLTFEIGIICDCVTMLKVFNELTFSKCKVTDKEVQIITKAIEEHATLQTLDISCNKISDDGVIFIRDCLKVNQTLCTLNLSSNQITDKGVETLVEAVTINKSLQSLDISYNIISDDCTLSFSNCLKSNEKLKELNISGNRISDEGTKKLAEAIQVNTTLQTLNISENWISKEGIRRIVKACKKNRTLHKLVCTHNNLSESGLAAINGYIRKKEPVQIFDASWNSIEINNHKVTIITTFHLIDLNQKFQSTSNYQKKLCCVDETVDLQYRVQVLQCCFEEYLNKESINLQNIQLNKLEVEILSECLKLNNTVIDLNLSGCLPDNNDITIFLTIISCLKITNTLRKLNFSKSSINDTIVEALMEAIVYSTTLQKLNLSHNTISDNGVFFIYSCLKVNRTLCGLDLCGNNITNKGAKVLAESIQISTTLQVLNISKNRISEEGIMRILEACANTRTLCKLVCTHNILSESGLMSIIEYIKKEKAVQVFDASWNSIGTKNGILVNIINLQLDTKQDLYYKELWPVREVTKHHTNEFLCGGLETEHFKRIGLTEIEILSGCFRINNTLTKINLSNNNITDKGVKKLAKAIRVNTLLQSLDISCNTISSDGILALSSCLKICKKLCKLNISNNNITDVGANYLSEVIQVNTTLQELNVSKNLISKGGIMKIVEACTKHKALCKLVCTHNNLSKSRLTDIIKYIKKENAVQIFDASWNSISIKLDKLAIKTNFQSFNILQPDDNSDNIQEELWFVNKITEVEFRMEFLHCCFESEKIVNLHSIRMTDYFEIEIISDSLKMNDTLSELILSNNKITDAEIKKIVEAVEVNVTLQHLDISHNTITDHGISAIRNCLIYNKALCRLNLSKNHITDKGAKKLAEAIQGKARVQELNISKNFISKEGIMKVVKACTVSGTLRKLVCTHNNLSKSGLTAISKCIIGLQEFHASWNSISTKNGRIAIKTHFQSVGLEQKTPLDSKEEFELWCLDEITELEYRKKFLCCCFENTVIKLEHTKMTNTEVEILNNCLQNNSTLTELNLSDCFTDNIITDAILSISKCINIGSLCNLDLSTNQITDNDIRTLTEAVMVNTTLQILNVSHNIISDNGVSFISEYLKQNKTLHELILSENFITDKGARLLAEAIHVSTTLQELNISKNCISKEGIMEIVKACTKHGILHKLACTHNNLSKSGLEGINEYIMIREEITVQILNTSWNSICTKNDKLDIKTLLQGNEELQTEDDDDIQYYINANIPAYSKRWSLLLHCCFEEYLNEQSVNLQDVKMNDVEIKVLVNCLNVNRIVTELNLSNYNKDANPKLDDILAISNCLKVNKTLHKLNLSRNYITNEGAKNLAEAIEVNSTLMELDLSKNHITKEGAVKIIEGCSKSKTLHKLVFTHNNLFKSDLIAINEHIKGEKTVQVFEASWNSICTENGKLAVVTTLHTLQLSDDGVYKELCDLNGTELEYSKEDFIHYCTEYLNMQIVSLQNITTEDFEVLCFISFVMSSRITTELTLSNCTSKTPNFIPFAISEIFKNTNGTLYKLNLSSNQITDKGVQILTEAVAINKTLKILELPHNVISDDGVFSLTECLRKNKTLHELNLFGNNITNQGAKKLAVAIKINTTLQEINIFKNWINEEGVMEIAEACATHETLYKLICTHNNLTKSGLALISEYIRENNAVQMFEGSWNNICTAKHKLAIETTIQPLLQSEYGSVRKEIWYVDEITDLMYRTEFLYCCFEEHMKEHDADLQDMRMDSFEVEILDDHLKINNTCIELDVSSSVMISHWLTCIVTSIDINTKLQMLDLSCVISNDGIPFINSCLKTNNTLCELNLSENDITDEGAKRLAEAIQINTVLQELDISKNWLSKEGILRMLEACTTNRTLHKLVCRHNNVLKSGIEAIIEYIRKEKAVQIFDASWNNIYTDTQNKLAIKTTFQMIDVNHSQCEANVQHDYWYEYIELKYRKEILHCCFNEYLNEKTVSLQSIHINDYEIEIICDCLKRNKILVELSLSDLSVSNDCHPVAKFEVIKSLGDCLKINDTLHVLKFSSNHISDDEVKILMEAVSKNMVLQKLDLSQNVITDHGISSLSNCLKINKTLRELNLSRNNITEIGAKRLAESIQINVTLLELNVSKNLISKEGVMKLVVACTTNKTLCKLDCTYNNISKSGLAEVNKYIREKNAIQVFKGSWNSIGTKLGKLVIITNLPSLHVNRSEDQNIFVSEDMWYVNEIEKVEHRKKFLQCCLESEQNVNIKGIGMAEYFEIEMMCDCLRINKTITELTLSKIRFTDTEAEKIAKVLKVNTTLQSVNISHNIMSDNGMFMIIDCLKNNCVLRKLNVSKNSISNEGAWRLAEAIQVNKALQEVNISKNFISKERVLQIVEACTKRRMPLHKLVCTHNNLSKPGLDMINDYIREENALQIFHASWNSIGTRYGTLVIITTYNLLDMDSHDDTHDDTHKELWFVNEIPKEHRREFLLCCFSSAQNINLQNVRMTDYNGIEIISDSLNMLVELNLSNSGIDNKGIETIAEAIKANTTLQNLDVSCNTIYSDGIEAVSECLKANKTLRKLNISENCIGDWGAKYLVEAVQVNTTLLELDISKNEMSRGGVMKILEACTNKRTLQKLLCTHNKLIESDVADINEYIKRNNAVQVFDMSWNNIIAKYVSEMDAQRYFLIVVKFQSSTQLVDGNLETKYNKENELWLVDDNYGKWHNNNIKYSFMHDAVTELKFLPCIKSSLILHHCVQAILQIDTLKKLDISGHKISDNGAICFSKCLKTKGTLIELGLSGNNISRKGVSAIANAMRNNTTIQKLDVSKNEISDNEVTALSECLKTNTTLRDLDVSHNSISCKGVSAMAEVLQVNNAALQKLDISNCIAGDDGAIAFSKCLKTNTKLIELKISGSEITSNGICAIAEAMLANNTLQRLDISNNKISDSGIIFLNKYLERNLSLVELNISGNGITSQGASTIAKAMLKNTILRNLDISNNKILDDGIKVFSEYLKTNPPLAEIKISQNGITSDGASAIAWSLQMNTTLQKLDISCNKISNDGAIALSECLKINTTLTELNASRDYFTCDEGVKGIVEGIQANKGLRSLTLCTGNMKASSYTCRHSFHMSVLTALYHNDTITELTLSMPFPLSHHTGLLNELEKINSKRRKNGVDLVKFNYVDECN